MRELLFLAHRIPFPPNKGDKIRSYHFLRGLAERYRVRLGAFVDDPDDAVHEAALREICAEVRLVPLRPSTARIRSVAQGYAAGTALSLPYFRSRALAAWVRDVARAGGVERVFLYSSPMAQYADLGAFPAGTRTVVDFVDVDSDKWRQYAERKPWPLSAVYAREARRLAAFEHDVAARADASVFVSEAEAGFFRREVAPESATVLAVENGVDTGYFSPERDYPDPFEGRGPAIVFTGAMDYWANVDAVEWFAEQVLPGVLREVPAATFWIVGARPAEAVRRLERRDGVRVTGTVADVRPYLAHAAVAVAPLRVARGIQNKILEAMAMARPVVASAAAMDGIEAPADARPTGAAEPDEWVREVVSRVSGERPSPQVGLRRAVLERYGWPAKVARIVDLMEPSGERPAC